jgi:hypothetical protein
MGKNLPETHVIYTGQKRGAEYPAGTNEKATARVAFSASMTVSERGM